MQDPIKQAIKHCCEALDGKKAVDLKVLDLRGKSTITDFFIIATASSEPHLRALRRALEEVMDAESLNVIGVDYQVQSGWLVVDAFQFMVHVFTQEQRANYALDALWRDGKNYDWSAE